MSTEGQVWPRLGYSDAWGMGSLGGLRLGLRLGLDINGIITKWLGRQLGLNSIIIIRPNHRLGINNDIRWLGR